MAGLASYMLAGAAQGLGTGIVDRAKSLAAAALEKKREETRQAERAEDRAWGLQDLATKRQWDLDDANTQRQWDLDDAATARKPQEDATAAFNRLFGGDQTGGGDALSASYVRDELMRRGLPQHVAEGFVLSMDDESGLRPGVNEANPTVAGSRGGYGLYQLTGPRRVAFENWAAQSGRPTDDQAQFDFLAMELQGPERAAAEKIMATRDRNEAAGAIAQYFLRPREDHLARRLAKYGTPAAPSQDSDRRALLAQVLALPGLSDGQRAVIEDELKRMEPPKPQSAKGKEAADRAAGLLPAADGWRKATPEEAAEYGAQAGQFDGEGRFYPVNPPSGMTVYGPDNKPIVQMGGGGARFTEGQSKDNVYSVRARGALPDVDAMGDALANWGDVQLDRLPAGLGRYIQSDQYKIAQNAGREFLTALLRKDTGAAITGQEEQIYGSIYLPEPGDPPGLLVRKKEARARAVAAIEAGMSPEQIIAQERALEKGGTNAGMSDADLFGKYGLTP